MNLSMREFEEVGTTIADLASEDATVVMGTVIDPDMNDEIRVTVVATGLGHKRVEREKPMKLVRTGTDDRPVFSDDDEDDAPTIGRASVGATGRSASHGHDVGRGARNEAEQKELDYLDIPAFLRNQAD
jgi:cell division protein FtsZ